MKPNIQKIKQLIDENFQGNQSAFAKTIGVERSHLCKILKNGSGAGAHFFGCLIAYCNKNGLDYKDYIFLPTSVKKINIIL